MDAGVESNGILLDDDLFLDEGVDLLLEEVALVNIVDLQLLIVFLQVGNVFNNFLEDVVGRLRGVVLERSALGPQELHFLLVVVQKLDGLFRASLLRTRPERVTAHIGWTYIKGVDSVLDWESASCEVAILTHGIHDSSHGGVLGDCVTHVNLVFHF